MPFRNGNMPVNATIWTEEMLEWLKENFFQKTNAELAKHLNVRLTVLRNKTRELGLRRIEMEYWTEEQIKFLKDNYKSKGDVEIAEIFQEKFPKNKKWNKRHINKKRKYLKLHRTEKEIAAIIHKNVSPGGKSFTILNNSSSINMHDSWVVQRIAWRDKDLQQEIMNHHPELIEVGRNLLKLKQEIKKQRNDTKGNN